MPPRYVKTIQDEIYYEYAKLMSRSAFNKLDYGFIVNQVKYLRSGRIAISGTIREWMREQQLPKQCVFCEVTDSLQMDHLIPVSRGGQDVSENMVWSCQKCNATRGNKGIYEWLGLEAKDNLHRLVAGKYLKQLLDIHGDEGTLNVSREDLKRLCRKCSLPRVCAKWGKERETDLFLFGEYILTPCSSNE